MYGIVLDMAERQPRVQRLVLRGGLLHLRRPWRGDLHQRVSAGIMMCTIRGLGSIIRGHRPNYSLGGKFLANREGDYESCFREGEENYKAGYGKGMGRKFLLINFLCKIRG